MAVPIRYSWRSLNVRQVNTLSTAGGIALAVLVVVLLLALVSGLRQALLTAGDVANVVVLRPGSTSELVSVVQRDQLQALRYLPGVARSDDGEPLVSPELIVQPFLQLPNGRREPISVRGVTPTAFRLHRNVRFVAGRPPRSSVGEAVLGRRAFHRYQDDVLGRTVRFGRRNWTVVGIFAAEDSSLESEVWVDAEDLFEDANRSWYSSVRLRVDARADREVLMRRIAEDPRILLEAKPELSYFADQAEGANTLSSLVAVLALFMGIGTAFGATNAMYAAVTARTMEIGMLRALGFSRCNVLVSFIGESLFIALIGFVVGLGLGGGAVALVNGMTRGIPFQLPPFSSTVVGLQISPVIALWALAFAVGVGLLGGLFPALRAARLPMIDALRRG